MSKPPRPPVMNLDSLMVRKPEAVPVVVPDPQESKPATGKDLAATFRTSVYFSRAVHDKLRLIAFEERKTITDLINEGLDHVLTSRNYPTVGELRATDKI
ncbi:ribbon-helix-helix domain-containing protein [Lichenifustis flavocetrariae]|uniref:Antitoxin-like ribbon-helix-helix domain-containing protein n=1 Tax=Lichenifustis flavocetrariae TaxID=2949735 RepID=A0AA41Z1L6_9HYPH|nr:ribbon-helix-helix domain-containing protein [Lichenifustis flavocetrariae]MCW6511306.1 hypothetical protein [Lichenifustis flavocetrariae]